MTKGEETEREWTAVNQKRKEARAYSNIHERYAFLGGQGQVTVPK